MSEENVEIVRRVYDAYLSGHFDAALAMIDPEVEWDGSIRPEGKIYRGHGGVIEALRTWTGTWEAFRLDVEEIIDAGDQVIVVEQQSGRGKGSGLPVRQQNFSVFTLRDGRIIRVVFARNRDEALEAAGLKE
jgi:ketosteroid isomerase-like protein